MEKSPSLRDVRDFGYRPIAAADQHHFDTGRHGIPWQSPQRRALYEDFETE